MDSLNVALSGDADLIDGLSGSYNATRNAMKYFEWEGAVIEEVAELMAISHSDATGVVEAQPFYMQQSWGKCMDAQQTAAKILAAAQGE